METQLRTTPKGWYDMAKWKSPIFSDIRNKLGENVVFSMWKGRPYMRSYVTPANPKSLAQTANRLHLAALVTAWQTWIKGVTGVETAWNSAALSQLISGFNRYVKAGRGLVITTCTRRQNQLSGKTLRAPECTW